MTFNITRIPEDIKQSMIDKNIWHEESIIKIEQLRLLTLEHYDFESKIQAGQLMIHYQMAENAITIFKELLKIKFPIAKIRTIDNYGGDDKLSMEDNNSSCFNYRKIAGTDMLSMHAYGLAIDINPVQNPYLILSEASNIVEIYPNQGKGFLNRDNIRPGMITPEIVRIFSDNGFTEWGGNWIDTPDYHHFQVQRRQVG